jgi:Zn-dependent peptidase ImmA (M78 family)
MDIKHLVRNLVKKYYTRNPYIIADYLNIEIILLPMPSHLQRQTCAHELGHALLHKGWGYYFMIKHIFY